VSRHIHGDNYVVTTNVTPQVVCYDDFDPWGMTLGGRSSNAGDSRQRYRYIGKERDSETGLDWLDARGYDSRVGRFMSVDPLTMKFHAWSPYQYSFDNPVRFWDPTGMEPQDEEEEQKGRQKEDQKSLGAKSAAGLTLPRTMMAFRRGKKDAHPKRQDHQSTS
jgi:RHS repeat-associated protein